MTPEQIKDYAHSASIDPNDTAALRAEADKVLGILHGRTDPTFVPLVPCEHPEMTLYTFAEAAGVDADDRDALWAAAVRMHDALK